MAQQAEQLEAEKNKVYEKSISSQKDFMQFREECNEKVEKEARAHRETLSRLHSKDLENKGLENKLESLNEKLNSAKQFYTIKENELIKAQSQISLLEKDFKEREMK